MNKNANKSRQLGMPFGTANGKLRKMILFALIKKYGEDNCYRCKTKIEELQDFSIEHKKAWLNIDVNLFWDLNNITFSHLKCNVSTTAQRPRPHGTYWNYGRHKCRCSECTKANTNRKRSQRQSL